MTLPLSGYKGVRKKGNRWMATGCINRNSHYIGMYDTAEEASAAYLKWAERFKQPSNPRRSSDYYQNEGLPRDKVKIVEGLFLRMKR